MTEQHGPSQDLPDGATMAELAAEFLFPQREAGAVSPKEANRKILSVALTVADWLREYIQNYEKYEKENPNTKLNDPDMLFTKLEKYIRLDSSKRYTRPTPSIYMVRGETFSGIRHTEKGEKQTEVELFHLGKTNTDNDAEYGFPYYYLSINERKAEHADGNSKTGFYFAESGEFLKSEGANLEPGQIVEITHPGQAICTEEDRDVITTALTGIHQELLQAA